jgi:hypothetical protein
MMGMLCAMLAVLVAAQLCAAALVGLGALVARCLR